MINDKIFFDEKDPAGINYDTPFIVFGSFNGRLWSKTPEGTVKFYVQEEDIINDLTTGGAESPLSAEQGVEAKALIDGKVAKAGDTMTGDLGFEGGERSIGTEDANALIFKTNNTERGRIGAAGGLNLGGSISAGGGISAQGGGVSAVSVFSMNATNTKALVASGGTFDFAVPSQGGCLVNIGSFRFAGANNFTVTMFSVVGRSFQGYTITSLGSRNGAAAIPFTVAHVGTTATLRVTNTSAFSTNIFVNRVIFNSF